MAYEVVMPRLGWNMEEGSLVEWLKKDGEKVAAGDILFSIESDKAIQEVESLESGILRIPPDAPQPGVKVPVGTRLAYLLEPGEPLPFHLDQSAQALMAAPAQAMASKTPTEPPSVPVVPARSGQGMPAISPRAARIAAELGVEWHLLKGSGRTGRIVEKDVRQAAERSRVLEVPSLEVNASPLARRVAQATGVDLAWLAGQMPGKRIERADVEAAAHKTAPEITSLPSPAITPQPTDKILPISQVRRVTLERMSAGAHTAAPVTLTTEVDATELVLLRKQLKADNAPLVPSYNDLLTKIIASALQEHPQLNARFEGEKIIQSSGVHVGMAVDTERGLLAPVLRDVQAKSLLQIAEENARLIERARDGQLRLDELNGGTFTITNLGMYEIDAFTPIINLPECAILGVGRIQPKQVVIDIDAERLAIRHMLFLSLTFDHRLVDGAPAARFLQRVKQFVEKPYLWLVRAR